MAEVDLEVLASGYDHRPPSLAARGRARRAAEYAGLGSDAWALDVGGGRGAHAEEFAGTGARTVLVDRSTAMAREAAQVAGVSVVIGDAASLPFREEQFDLVYLHLSVHYGDWSDNLAEACRVARGAVWIWTLGSDHHSRSFLARWFPGIVPIDEARFPEPEAVAAGLAAFGLGDVEVGREVERVERTAGNWRAAVEAGFVSSLHMIPQSELASGLAGFDREHPDPSELLAYDLRFSWVRGRRPSLR